MSLLPRLTRGSDNLDTPLEAVRHLWPYLPLNCLVWECAPGNGVMVKHLKNCGFRVIDEKRDFLTVLPFDCDVIMTNPPFSKKAQFIARCMEIGKPWALLLPVTTLGVRACQKNLHNAEIVFLPKRIDFTGKKAPWFAVAWFTWGLNIGRQMTFL